MDYQRNELLAALPSRLFELVKDSGSLESFVLGQVIQDEHEEVGSVYFPLSGMFSRLVVMKTGQMVESAVVGREGAVGARAGLGLYKSIARFVAQLPTEALVISAIKFRKLVAQSDPLRDLCVKSTDALLDQVSVTAACNSIHVVEARFCRWLLHTADRAESNEFTLTQELLSEMLSVRRTSVTDIASQFRKKGILSYARGNMKIVNRRAIEGAACECYRMLKKR